MILWCAEFLGDYQFPYPSSTGTIAYNIVTRLLDKKININVADPRASKHKSFITPSGKAQGRLFATYEHRDINDLVLRMKPEKIVTDDVHLAGVLLSIPNNPEVVLIAKTPEIPRMLAEGLTVVAVSNAMMHALQEKDIQSTYIPLGVDLDTFKKIDKRKRGFIFGCVCRNKGEKNLYSLIDAYRLFNDNFKDAAALAIHTDNGVWDARGIAKKLGVENNVFFGNWPADMMNMSRVYNSFDVHINVGGKEWSALPVLESMACGCTQIVSGYGVLREYAEGCGILVPARPAVYPGYGEVCVPDVEKLEQAMEKLWMNDTERNKSSDAALKNAKRWERSAELWEKLLCRPLIYIDIDEIR